ncbi:hypothetical protein [uncultured Cytophaga sp.]|uniref:hypothetical protein n=1 Tax=uncultured Cytophaga sp. TaxID=160238 RepID=UPI0026062FD0|nr:hypothetical protein [uncultured Cytophaga sp.]
MDPSLVTPGKWSNITLIFNDTRIENFSVIWGLYTHSADDIPKWCIASRWNGWSTSRGYPGQANYPLWFCEPSYLSIPILNGLIEHCEANLDELREWLNPLRETIDKFNALPL